MKIAKNSSRTDADASKNRSFRTREIIFEATAKAKGLYQYLPKMQVIFLFLVAFVGIWSFYYYHMYRRSDLLLSEKQRIDCDPRCLCRFDGRFCDLAGNIADMIKTGLIMPKLRTQSGAISAAGFGGGKKRSQADYHSGELDQYRKTGRKANLNEISLQRDIAISERDELRRQLVELQETVEDY